MFSWIKIHFGIKNKEKGFSIKINFIDYGGYLTYKEGPKKVTMFCERLVGDIDMEVYLGVEEHWEPPYEKECITRDEWKRIGDNIKEAYESRKINVDVTLPSPSDLAKERQLIKDIRERRI